MLDALVGAFGLGAADTVVDLGRGTGQLSLPLAARVGAVIGVDPEPDMLTLARQAALNVARANATWLLGADSDLPALGRLLGERTIGALTVAVAIHLMDRDTLFRAARPLLRAGGGVAVVTNGAPLWLQDAEWSGALRECLERLLGHSALSADRLPSTQGRSAFAAEVRDALGGRDQVTERVRVWLQFGTPA
ncbi:methyltransferase domain-containing protein [Micromonospora sp. NPDC002717]|uniref:class I SAM-dependent methyltransferase n=1 Tax=Micromonospora sp. NPDC002717 TaxID=3154424 RepID=UPI00332C7959